MPSKNRTFSEKDVIRIANRNLTREERREVVLTLCRGFKDDQEADVLPSPEEEAIEAFSAFELISNIFSILSSDIFRIFGRKIGVSIIMALGDVKGKAVKSLEKELKK